MKFPYGITGFHFATEPSPPEVNVNQFKQICYGVALRNKGRVIDIQKPRDANYYCAEMQLFDKTFFILLNCHYPYVAFASTVEYGDISFIEPPTLEKEFSSIYYVLKSKELNAPFDESLVENSELNEAELDQISYWKPETIGEIIFNQWD